jgi:hypothetical protein
VRDGRARVRRNPLIFWLVVIALPVLGYTIVALAIAWNLSGSGY